MSAAVPATPAAVLPLGDDDLRERAALAARLTTSSALVPAAKEGLLEMWKAADSSYEKQAVGERQDGSPSLGRATRISPSLPAADERACCAAGAAADLRNACDRSSSLMMKKSMLRLQRTIRGGGAP